MAEILLIQAKCEDGENIEISTEWEMPKEKVIGAFVALGIKIGVDILGDNANLVYKMFAEAFQKLQNKETLEEALKMVEE